MMLTSERLDTLFALLEDMTLTKRSPGGALPPHLRHLQTALALGFVAAILSSIVTAYLYQQGYKELIAPDLPIALYLFSLLLAIGHLVISGIELYRMFRRDGKGPFAAIMISLRKDLEADAAFVERLGAFDKPTLAYALVQYSHRWDVLDGRQMAIAGDIRKLGLFPALAAAAMSAATLLKGDSAFILWAPLILACCFYIIAFCIIPQRERPAQVVALLKYAIDRSDDRAKASAISEARNPASPAPPTSDPKPVAPPQAEPASMA